MRYRHGVLGARQQTYTYTVSRRRFVAWFGGVALLSACDRSQLLTGPVFAAVDPNSDSPIPSVNVRDFSAVGDGETDDTTSFATAIAYLKGIDGGILEVPAGVYCIDPVRGIRVCDNLTLRLDPNAILKALPVATSKSGVVHIEDVKNVTISGGTIVGERDEHLGTGGEGGHGIRIWGAKNVLIEGVVVKGCWGDGIYIGPTGWYGPQSTKTPAENITISKCVCLHNRRQGLSIVACVGALIEDSEFSDTVGTAPSAGIDLEPGATFPVNDITIRNCRTVRNAGYGILLCANTDIGGSVLGARIEGNQSAYNALDGIVLMRGVCFATVTGNRILNNGRSGVVLDAANDNEILANDISDNSTEEPLVYPSLLITSGSSDNVIRENSFNSGPKRLSATYGPDIVVASGDCLRNVIEAGKLKTGTGREGDAHNSRGGLLTSN